MKKVNVKELQKEITELGILNIEAYGEFSPECLQDAVAVVRSVNLDFKALAAEARKKRENPSK